MTMEDLSHTEPNADTDEFDSRISEAGALIEELTEVDPAAAAEPAGVLADLLSGLLEAEDHRSGA
jgi:hypothetical protein